MAMIKLADISTRAPEEFEKKSTREKLVKIYEKLDELQNMLYAGAQHALLVVLQGMDASGKDGVIRKVFGAMNPQGLHITSFKVPTQKELSHDFLWRVHGATPARGMVGIFNRSHYEDILVTRVHKWCDDETARRRMKAINDFEQLLTEHNSTTILKFYLHISPEEQRQRLEERVHDETKNWKYNEKDMAEAEYWDDYRRMYEDCFEHCSAIPWTIVPADQNWYKEYVIATAVRDALVKLNMQYPRVSIKQG